MQKYDLICRYDSRKSFYGKAKVLETINKNVEDYKLYSYETLVARITKIGNIKTFYYFGKYSQTTTRHQKEFFKQNDLNDKEIKELFRDGKLEKEIITIYDTDLAKKFREKLEEV